MDDPQWWPKNKDRKVPGYIQLIISSGPTDIGIHLDVFGPTKIPVNTYLTICRGVKQVIMLPPGQTLFKENEPFPISPTNELITSIHSAGGFYFQLKPLDNQDKYLTLFVPKNWHHWLLGRTQWAVVFGSSCF